MTTWQYFIPPLSLFLAEFLLPWNIAFITSESDEVTPSQVAVKVLKYTFAEAFAKVCAYAAAWGCFYLEVRQEVFAVIVVFVAFFNLYLLKKGK